MTQPTNRDALQSGGNLERFILDVVGRSPLASRVRQAQQPATPLPFAANWTDYATSVPDVTQTLCGSWRDKSGVVHVQGLVRRVTAGFAFASTVGTLPPEHRPATTHGFGLFGRDSVLATGMYWTTVDAAGAIILQGVVGAANGGVGTIVYLDAIKFRLD